MTRERIYEGFGLAGVVFGNIYSVIWIAVFVGYLIVAVPISWNAIWWMCVLGPLPWLAILLAVQAVAWIIGGLFLPEPPDSGEGLIRSVGFEHIPLLIYYYLLWVMMWNVCQISELCRGALIVALGLRADIDSSVLTIVSYVVASLVVGAIGIVTFMILELSSKMLLRGTRPN